jgi:hypothetical protein
VDNGSSTGVMAQVVVRRHGRDAQVDPDVGFGVVVHTGRSLGRLTAGWTVGAVGAESSSTAAVDA